MVGLSIPVRTLKATAPSNPMILATESLSVPAHLTTASEQK